MVKPINTSLTGVWTNLFVAIATPLRSLINPIRAYFTESVLNIVSGVDPRVMNTYIIPKNNCLIKLNMRIRET